MGSRPHTTPHEAIEPSQEQLHARSVQRRQRPVAVAAWLSNTSKGLAKSREQRPRCPRFEVRSQVGCLESSQHRRRRQSLRR